MMNEDKTEIIGPDFQLTNKDEDWIAELLLCCPKCNSHKILENVDREVSTNTNMLIQLPLYCRDCQNTFFAYMNVVGQNFDIAAIKLERLIKYGN